MPKTSKGDVMRLRRGRIRPTNYTSHSVEDLGGLKVAVVGEEKLCTDGKTRVACRAVQTDGTVVADEMPLDVPVDDLRPTVATSVKKAVKTGKRLVFGGVHLPWQDDSCRLHHQHEPGICQGF